MDNLLPYKIMSLSYFIIRYYTSSSFNTGNITDRNFLLAALCTLPKIERPKTVTDLACLLLRPVHRKKCWRSEILEINP